MKILLSLLASSLMSSTAMPFSNTLLNNKLISNQVLDFEMGGNDEMGKYSNDIAINSMDNKTRGIYLDRKNDNYYPDSETEDFDDIRNATKDYFYTKIDEFLILDTRQYFDGGKDEFLRNYSYYTPKVDLANNFWTSNKKWTYPDGKRSEFSTITFDNLELKGFDNEVELYENYDTNHSSNERVWLYLIEEWDGDVLTLSWKKVARLHWASGSSMGHAVVIRINSGDTIFHRNGEELELDSEFSDLMKFSVQSNGLDSNNPYVVTKAKRNELYERNEIGLTLNTQNYFSNGKDEFLQNYEFINSNIQIQNNFWNGKNDWTYSPPGLEPFNPLESGVIKLTGEYNETELYYGHDPNHSSKEEVWLYMIEEWNGNELIISIKEVIKLSWAWGSIYDHHAYINIYIENFTFLNRKNDNHANFISEVEFSTEQNLNRISTTSLFENAQDMFFDKKYNNTWVYKTTAEFNTSIILENELYQFNIFLDATTKSLLNKDLTDTINTGLRYQGNLYLNLDNEINWISYTNLNSITENSTKDYEYSEIIANNKLFWKGKFTSYYTYE